jgi:hypothetical protein
LKQVGSRLGVQNSNGSRRDNNVCPATGGKQKWINGEAPLREQENSPEKKNPR